ncbi:MAG: YcgN family cysteine cluster protein, partial [Hyphomicrobiales bacterium]
MIGTGFPQVQSGNERQQLAFWDEKTLEEMTVPEWEALCDGCGRCCLMKLEDEDSGEIFTSDVHCRLLDGESCKCSDYPNRLAKVPDCIKLTPENVRTISWI